MSIAFAFLHHLAAFALVAALAVQLALLKGEVGLREARRLQRIDAVYGASAALLLAAGLVRVFWLEKGAGFYLASAPFLAKLGLFLAVGLLSIYPTLTFRRWSAAVKGDTTAPLAAQGVGRLRLLIQLQLVGVVLILLFAAMMARGVGFLG